MEFIIGVIFNENETTVCRHGNNGRVLYLSLMLLSFDAVLQIKMYFRYMERKR